MDCIFIDFAKLIFITIKSNNKTINIMIEYLYFSTETYILHFLCERNQ